MITQYINSISSCSEFDYSKFENVLKYNFTGDGSGDFEKYANSADSDVVKTYIEYCYDQIKLATEYLDSLHINNDSDNNWDLMS